MTDDLGLSPILIAAFGGTGGNWLPGRTRVEEEEHHDHEDGADRDHDPGESALGLLLRHEAPVSCAERVDNEGAPAHSRLEVASWLDRNRVWFVPWISALLVVGIEISAALFAAKPIPVEGHAVLGAFWIFAVGRGSSRAYALQDRERRLQLFARQHGIPLEAARDMWHVFQADVERIALPRGKDRP